MKILLNMILILTIFSMSAKAINMSSDFKKCKSPQLLDRSDTDFAELSITIQDGAIIATRYVNSFPGVSKTSINGGILEGIDCGEWGGVVRFLSNTAVSTREKRCYCFGCRPISGKPCHHLRELPIEEKNILKGVFENVDHVKYNGKSFLRFSPRDDASINSIIDENCRGFLMTGNRCFTITGLSHLGRSYGKIYELTFSDDVCIANKICDVGCCPETFLVAENTIYLATGTSLLALKDTRLYKLANYDGWLCPGSLVYSDGCLFIGMRAGWVCKYNLRTKKIEWYRYIGPHLR